MHHSPRHERAPRRRALRTFGWTTLALCAALAAGPASGQSAAAEVTATAADSTSPTSRIDALHVSLLDVMKRAVELGYEGRERQLATVIPSYYDLDYMAQKSLGPHWNSADAESRHRYLETFTRFTIANYAGRFDGYSGQSFETLGEEKAPSGTAIVKSRLIDPQGENVELNYRMRQVGGAWKIIDVYLDGTVSELALRRSEFVSIVKRENLDALLIALDAKIAKLAADRES
jgi:phospholipid transport system substrate-binding protein